MADSKVLSKLFEKSHFCGQSPPALGRPPLEMQPSPSAVLCCTREGSEELGCQKQEAVTGTRKSNWEISSSPCTVSISILYIYTHTQHRHLREFRIHCFSCSPHKTESLKSLSNYKGLLQLKNKFHHLFQGYLIS